MKTVRKLTSVALAMFMACGTSLSQAANCQRILGTIGASSQWGSGWIDLSDAEFNAGDNLRLSIGGTASKVLIRILRTGESPDSPTGILGQFSVPKERFVEFKLSQDFKRVKQISVHGGSNPWGQFPLGGGNGPATIMGLERCTK
ncbi:MAG: hypothetical protein KZQ81_15815 [Candidatus Thiodiazotropha sp. (ex Rostrolucina anterorostrata)]|nr:hypothetical protein [Candidatus Thiodiazotropha sp. (ex Rostrolucina anterorostrata)]